jgi:methionyl-tRNA synthetase
VPEYDTLTDADRAIIARSEEGFEEVGKLIEQVNLRDALAACMALAREANGYLDLRKPWSAIKEDPADAARSVYTILRVIDNLNVLFSPFLPFAAQKVHEFLGYDGAIFGDLRIDTFEEDGRAHEALVYDGSHAIGRWDKRRLPAGQPLREPQALFTKLEPEIIDQERALLGAPRDEREVVVG